MKNNNSEDIRNDISKELLRLARYWRRLPTSLKKRIVREIYEECGSLRKTARILGISKTSVYYYTKQKDPLCYISSIGIALGLFKTILLPQLIQQLNGRTVTSPKLSAGNDESINRSGGENIEQ